MYHQSSTHVFLKYSALKTLTELKSEWDRESQCLRYTSGTQEETFDLNTVTSNGTYSFWNPTNSPVGAGWVCLIVIQMANNPNYCVQLAMSQSNRMFMRLETGGSWGEWVSL